ncbi:MAG: LolA family protein [Mobilitalea sp.]
MKKEGKKFAKYIEELNAEKKFTKYIEELNSEKKITEYIDELNAEKRPKEHRHNTGMSEHQRLMDAVRKVRGLREPEYPEENYQKRLIAGIKGGIPIKEKNSRSRFIKHALVFTTVAAAAAVILFVSVNSMLQSKNTSIAYAMEQALKGVKAYHGILEVVETNELGETMTQAKREIWADQEGTYYIKELEGILAGLITASNGQQKWQIRPEEETSYLFTTFPDPYHFSFELGNEIDEIKNALTIKLIGEEMISGRETSLLEVTPDGGEAYQLWIDKETDLPIQRQSAMQNAIQYKVTYRTIEYMDKIPKELLVYSLPKGYEEIDKNPEQIIATLEEAESIVGFLPKVPFKEPKGYTLKKITIQKNQTEVKFYYYTADQKKTVIVLQSKAKEEFAPDASAILGTVNRNTAEIRTAPGAYSIRWQEQGMEYSVLGNTTLEELSLFAETMALGEVIIPSQEEVIDKPQIDVAFDLVVEENDQKSVDAGHSPWRLDPVFVTQVFASLLISPEGIVGDYPIAYEDIKIVTNNGVEAIAKINSKESIAAKVYLKRLIRQDDTGIWTVVGYDTAD